MCLEFFLKILAWFRKYFCCCCREGNVIADQGNIEGGCSLCIAGKQSSCCCCYGWCQKQGDEEQQRILEECTICVMGRHPSEFRDLPCKHRMCKQCVDQLVNITRSNLCPTCKVPFKAASGPQPPGGWMGFDYLPSSLPGYENCGTIVITYVIPDGIQTNEHPHPGKPFTGTSRTAYLPDNEHGQRVCRLLEKAFDARLIFTVGKSLTTGIDNTVVWNDIHHKTSLSGQYGYPDANYLASVEADLRARGIDDY